ncbi:hypothetical protein MPH_08484 [Macrophomina phaseolina MS6]|uniref:Tat pathway signal sequence n=1 Tax=Macrophomina phaseolina (strain MS6) TaxID=1126212 RepID=K2RVR8_MACPH|nr:hypothetical protein MPH_08484 [Macrophomina phaseolina MS6]
MGFNIFEKLPFNPPNQKPRYKDLGGEDDEESIPLEGSHVTKQSHRSYGWVFWSIQALFFLLSLTLLTASKSTKPSDEQCSKQLSSWSPILDVPGLVKYESVNFDLAFDQASPYRGPPTPEREKLWDELWHMRGISVPDDKLEAMNRTDIDKKVYKKVAPELGGGYGALVETFHQLHCVSMLRQWSYKEYFEDKETFPNGLPEGLDGTPEIRRMHLDHCIEVLRLNLMCTADVTPFLVEVNPSFPRGEKADFNSNHKCRNFWDIKEWVKEHTVMM